MVRDRYTAPAPRRGFATRWVIAAALLLVSGCARPDGTAAPLKNAQLAAVEQTGPDRREFEVTSGGETIVLSQWAPEAEAKAVILAVHGYGDYGSSSFGDAAKDWSERGVVTYAYDQRGFGRNASNGDWPGHVALVDDLSAITALIAKRHPNIPLTLVGHSMGGGVVTAALGEGRVDGADRAVLLAPALWGGENLSPFLRALAHTANILAPDKRWTGDGIVEIQASDNIEMLRGLGRDPLYVRSPSSREFVGLIRLMDRAVESASNVSTPILVVYGAKDEVVPEEPILEAYEEFNGPKAYRKIDTGWHMLLRDLEGGIVRDVVAEYVLSPLSPEG